MIADKKQIQAVFLSPKWVIKQWRKVTTSTMYLTQELLMSVQCSGGSRSFAKEMRALKVSAVAGHQKLTPTTVESCHQSWFSYNYMRSCQRTQCRQILWSFGIWSKLERWKNLINGCLMSWQKVVILQCCLLLLYGIPVNHFSVGVMTSSVVVPGRNSKALPKAKLVPRKGHGHCLVVCCPSDPLELSES